MPSALTRRPQATALSIEQLLDLVLRGELRVPDFQRLFRWNAGHVRQLLDSIYRGYPVGTLLFWKREAPAGRIRFGPIQIDAPESAQALWVVDGQQRLTSLAGVLLHPSPASAPATDPFAVFFDLSNEQFVRPTRRMRTPPHWLPLNVVADSEALLGWLDRYALREQHPDHIKAAIKLGKSIREYQLPAYVVETDDSKILRVIFDRLNNSGKRLKREEVFNALQGGLSEAQPSDLSSLSKGLQELGFGTIEQQWLLKAVQAVRDLDVTRDFRKQIEPLSDLSRTYAETSRALADGIVFLKRDAGIPHVELLPYKFPLVLLARFFHLHREPSPRSRALLSRWIWRGAIAEIFGGENVRMQRDTLRALDIDEEQSVQRLLTLLPPRPEKASPLREFNFRNARSKLWANALISLSPRDLRTGRPLDASAVLQEHASAAFLHLVGASPGVDEKLKRSIANRIFHPPLGGRSALTLLSSIPDPDVDLLRSHAIPPEALAALKRGDLQEVLLLRQEWLGRHITQFLEARARWLESDRPSIHSLIVPEEAD